jgi:putative hydrolase of the HAD superfamily
MIKAITFDVWGTVLRTKRKTERKKILAYITKYMGKEYADAIFDRIINQREFLNEFQKKAGIQKMKKMNAMLNNYIKTNYIEYADVAEILKKMKKKYKIGLISNASFVTTEILKRWNKTNYFNSVIVSSEHGIRKPDKRIFQIAAKQLGVKVNELVHVGDSYLKDYLANKNGIKTVLIDRKNKRKHIKNKISNFKQFEKHILQFDK